MNYKKSFFSIILCLITVSISAQLKVDSIGDVFINKALKFNQHSSSQFHFHENKTLWSASNGGIKIDEIGKFTISPNDQGGNNILDTSVKYTFDPPYVYIHPSCMNAVDANKTNGDFILTTQSNLNIVFSDEVILDCGTTIQQGAELNISPKH